MSKIAIVGGGPAGCYSAELLAKAGHEVQLFEEHNQIGSPVQCTGIVTHSIEKFVKLPNKVVANRMDKVKVVTKNKELTTAVDEIVMWRNLFDQHMGDRAEKAGVRIHTNHKFFSLNKKSLSVKNTSNNKIKKIEADIIIGADGPSSPVAKAATIPHNNKFYIGMQAKVKHKLDTSLFETHFGTSFPNFFGWVVPESEDVVRLGLGATAKAQPLFYDFLKKVTGSKDIKCWESGIIPIHHPSQVIQKNKVFLIGDAASQVKATTGGGIIPSFKAAHTLADCITNKKNYQRAMNTKSGVELRLHLYLRKILNKFRDTDYDRLVEIMESERVKRILKKYDRDTPIPLLLNLMIKEPRLYGFGKVLFQ